MNNSLLIFIFYYSYLVDLQPLSNGKSVLINYTIILIIIKITRIVERFRCFKSARNPSGDCPIHFKKVANHRPRPSVRSENYGIFQILKNVSFIRGANEFRKTPCDHADHYLLPSPDQWIFAVSRPWDLVLPVDTRYGWRPYSMASGTHMELHKIKYR